MSNQNKKIIFFSGIFLILIISVIYALTMLTKITVDEPVVDETVERPYIFGKIYSVAEDQILVAEGLEGESFSGDINELKGNAIWLKIDEQTEILHNYFEGLTVGKEVAVWTTGVILEGYPAEGTASKIIVFIDEEEQNGEELSRACYVSGCSGEICSSDPEAISTCEFLPGMECLNEGANCTMVDNECSWVLSKESAACFLEVEKEHGDTVRESMIGYLFEKAESLMADSQ